jgi:pyrimidine-nucleoside phosphorylase
MLPYEIIMKKRDGFALSEEEMKFFVNGYVRGNIPDYQMAAFLMAVYFRGMTDKETTIFTRLMVESGETVDLTPIPGIKVDKHSTGGVADTTTLVLAPLVAAAGVPVAKMSGRGLGHTGGTLDKLESIPGMTVHLTGNEFIRQVKEIGIAVIGQTADLVPADRKMYALRDVTSTIDSIPLVAASVMSKKIAAGADAIVLDVKVGNGAFMQNIEDAEKVAHIMVSIGEGMGRTTRAIITDMNQPLGNYIGNSLEVREAIEILQGKHKGTPLHEVSLTLGSHMLHLAKAVENSADGRKKLEELLESGKGLEKMAQFIKAQKGNPEVTQDLSKLPEAEHKMEILSPKAGYVNSFDTRKIGQCALILGAGRVKKDDVIDPVAGLIVKKRIGDRVERGEPLAVIHTSDPDKSWTSSRMYLESINISEEKPPKNKLIWDIISHFSGQRLVVSGQSE